MAKNFMSSILDELMGRDRNALPTEQPKKMNWDDPDMCPHYLVCFCPHDLFVNTKADLGTCPKIHDDQMRKKYLEEAPSHKRSLYEAEFIRSAEKMIADIEAKIKRGKMRIALANGPDGGTYAGPGSKNAEKIALLTERINALLEEAEAAGCEGDVEKAQGLMKLCDQLKDEREQLKSNEVSHPWNPDKAMQVCEVCGSYLIIGEAQHRLDDHIMGKQHVGFAMLRKNLEDVKKAKETREREERERIEKERERRWGVGDRDRGDRDRERDRNKRDYDRNIDKTNNKRDRGMSGRERDRSDRDRDRHRDIRAVDKSKDKDKDRKKHRSGSRDQDKRKDRSEKSRDKESDKSRHRDSKDKDKDRSRRHSDDKRRSRQSRSGSKERDRNRKRSRSRSRDRKDKDKDRKRNRGEKDESGNVSRSSGEILKKDSVSPTNSSGQLKASSSPSSQHFRPSQHNQDPKEENAEDSDKNSTNWAPVSESSQPGDWD